MKVKFDEKEIDLVECSNCGGYVDIDKTTKCGCGAVYRKNVWYYEKPKRAEGEEKIDEKPKEKEGKEGKEGDYPFPC